ncbi:serine hydrolase [Thorsellia kenyensis]|uniref:serine-type D-Ala-D-Ala carboxypeptidase n=1 Tax=Thorsellia kenyensis TaxID=1549888 RepID=A0ABV6C776_9GAMM
MKITKQGKQNTLFNITKGFWPLFFVCCLSVIIIYSSQSLAQTTNETNLNLQSIAQTSSAPIEVPVIEAKAYILMDASNGQVLAEYNADMKLAPASLTKIMTSYVVGQFLAKGQIANEDIVTVSKNAWVQGNPELKGSSLMFLEPNQRVSVLDLNLGLVVQSGNDAAIALAEHVSGSQEKFIQLMNEYSVQMGLVNTHFKTVHGLDMDGQFSTARDMALLSKALIKDLPEEYKLNSIKEFTYGKIKQMNRNRLLWSDTLKVDGLKTGHTSGAGYNLVSSAYDDTGMRLIAVVLGTESDKKRFSESEKLLSFGFRAFETRTLAKAGTVLSKQPIWYGAQNEVELGLSEDAVLTFPRGQANQLRATQTLSQTVLEAPLNQGQEVGKVVFKIGETVIAEKPLVVLKAVEQGGFFSRLWDFIVLTVSGWFS